MSSEREDALETYLGELNEQKRVARPLRWPLWLALACAVLGGYLARGAVQGLLGWP